MLILSLCADILWKHDTFDRSHPSVSLSACVPNLFSGNMTHLIDHTVLNLCEMQHLHSYQMKLVGLSINLSFYDTIARVVSSGGWALLVSYNALSTRLRRV